MNIQELNRQLMSPEVAAMYDILLAELGEAKREMESEVDRVFKRCEWQINQKIESMLVDKQLIELRAELKAK